ncbi:hypothetical protein D9757_005044 [Collybiopsis confluens]|uniref:DUF6533 domain-containing protein n=1 Tax=Collybiopsis confluens TaxID=2823264 RepID=A0A8H5HT36_9AGAR|nr:hypothetical protein D9757_005044 [Collybiopsis confluens]
MNGVGLFGTAHHIRPAFFTLVICPSGTLKTFKFKNLARCVELIQFVILIYDWLLTFGQEYERFWQSDLRRLPAILFFVNRYLCLFGNIPVLFLYFWADTVSFDGESKSTATACGYFIHVWQASRSQLICPSLDFRSSIEHQRVTALYGGSSRIRIFLYAVVFVMVGNTLAQLYLTDTSPPPVIELSSVLKQIANVPVYTSEQGRHLTFLWLGMFVFDLSVFSLTLWKTLSQGIVGRGSVLTIVVRDGSMYFGIITLFTLANILVFALGAVSASIQTLIVVLN